MSCQCDLNNLVNSLYSSYVPLVSLKESVSFLPAPAYSITSGSHPSPSVDPVTRQYSISHVLFVSESSGTSSEQESSESDDDISIGRRKKQLSGKH